MGLLEQRAQQLACTQIVAVTFILFMSRRRDTSRIQSIAALPPLPLPTEPEMLFANPVSLARPTHPPQDSLAMPSIDFATCSARIGRGGRLILSRCQPFTLQPLEAEAAPAEEAAQRPAFDLTGPYLAAEAQYQQEQQHLPRQQSQGQLRQPSPSGQAAKAPGQQQPGSARAQGVGQAAASGQAPQASAAQPAGQQTRQQQHQQHPQLIEMPSQPGATLNGPSPPKSKV